MILLFFIGDEYAEKNACIIKKVFIIKNAFERFEGVGLKTQITRSCATQLHKKLTFAYLGGCQLNKALVE